MMTSSPDAVTDTLARIVRDGGTARIAAADPVAWEQWAAANDRHLLTLDTGDATTGAELVQALRDGFGFSDELVADFDDLDQVLGDLDVTPAAGLLVLWTGWDSVAMDDEPAMAEAVDVLRTAAQSWCDDGSRWTVLVVGDGPGWDLPWAGPPPAPWEHDDEDDDGLPPDPDDEASWRY